MVGLDEVFLLRGLIKSILVCRKLTNRKSLKTSRKYKDISVKWKNPKKVFYSCSFPAVCSIWHICKKPTNYISRDFDDIQLLEGDILHQKQSEKARKFI